MATAQGKWKGREQRGSPSQSSGLPKYQPPAPSIGVGTEQKQRALGATAYGFQAPLCLPRLRP